MAPSPAQLFTSFDCDLGLPHLRKEYSAFCLVGFWRFQKRDHDGRRLDLEIFDESIRDIFTQRALLLDRAAADGIDDNFRHSVVLSFFRWRETSTTP